MTASTPAQLSHLFQPGKLGKYDVANRIKYGACCVSNFNTTDGFVTERELGRMEVIAKTGCGIITNQGAYPDPLGEGKAYYSQIALYDDKFIPAFERIARDVHEAGAIGIQQILHAGRYGGIDLGYCVQPSVVPQTLPHFRPAREMDKEQIRECIRQHADAAKRAIKAGWDGVELTSFMGYLLANFCSPFTNQRTDEYGGDNRNRGRFMVELIQSVKEAIDDHPLVVRLNGNELMDAWGGNTEDGCFEHMEIAAKAGLDMISITVGWQEAPESSIGRDVKPGHWNYLARRAKELLPDVPIAFGVRLPDPVMADQCLKDGDFDFWEICRPLLADPELIHKAREGRLDERRRCIGSLNCLSRLFRDLPYTCTMNPALGHEYEPEYNITRAVTEKRIMIIGSGPSGMECAIAARKRGHQVTVYEKEDRIGGALIGYAANDLANKEDVASLVTHYEIMANKLGIKLELNTAPDPKMMRSMLHQYDVVVLATGARIEIGDLPTASGGPTVLNGMDVALGKAAPGASSVVVGAGKIGLALAETLKKQGKDVTLVEKARRIAGDVSPTWKWRHTSWVKELGIPTHTSATLTAIGGSNVTIADKDGSEQLLAADTVIMTDTIRPNQELYQSFQWMIDEIHVIGDAAVPRDLTEAIRDGFRLGCRL